ncbi:Transcription factor Sox-5 [Holothuria leucospilota]|uniref:Transcription factor Sox-5 n=1 Tax=Holothuria leucospilota TaxID=206669 RepID=A0A9Q0YT76_HOLLE|nr:Transcription factor Sox-5 [Holothuria leucospilota]
MAANGTLKSSFSLPREKAPLGSNVASLPLASSHREENRKTTNLTTHSGDEILKYMQSDISCNSGKDEASDSQVTSSITSIQKAIAEMLTNIRASTSQSVESNEESVSGDGSKATSEDQTTERSKAKATDSEKISDKGNKIKRPMNAFMVWAREYRQVLSKGFPKESNSQISVRLGDIWSNLTSEEKQPFYDKADRLRRQHEKDYPDWVYQPNKRRRTTASFPQTGNRVVMATAGQIQGVLNGGNLGQKFQIQISPPIKAGQVHQPNKNLQENSRRVTRQMSGLPQTATQQVKSINISQSQPVSTSGPGPQFQSPKRPATVPVDESPLAADKFHSLLSRYPMASVLKQLSPEPQKRRSKSTSKLCKKQQPLKAKTPQQTKTRKKGKKPSPEKASSKKVGHIRPSLPEPTKQAQQSWNCPGVPNGGVQTLVYSPYPTAAASMQFQNHAVPLVHPGQPIVQIPAHSQFVTAPPTGFMNMQRLPQQPTPRTFYHSNVMGPVSVVHRFPDPLTVRPDYSQPPPPLALPVQPGVMMNMYPTRPFLPIMQDFKPSPQFPGQVVTFGPRMDISNNKNNSNSAGIHGQNVYSNMHSNNNTNNSNNIIFTNTNINDNNTSSTNNAQNVSSNTVNKTTNVTKNTNKSNFSNIKTNSSKVIYTNTNIEDNTRSSNNAQNVFNNAINNITNTSSNNTNKSKLLSDNTNNRNITNTATNNKGNTSCSKNEQNFVNKTVNSTINLSNNSTNNNKSSNESTNSSNIIYNTNINGNVNNISSNNAQKAFTNIAIGKINTSNTNTKNSNCSNTITSRTFNINSSNNVQNVFSNTVNGKINLSSNTNNNNRSNSNKSRSYSTNSINNAREVFKNTVNSTTNVSNNSANRSNTNNTVNSTADTSSNSSNSNSQKMDNLHTIPSNNNCNTNIINTSTKEASNKDKTIINFPRQSHNTVNCVIDENNNEIITNIGDKTTMMYKVQNGVTAQGSVVYTAKQGETCDQSDEWMLQPPGNPPTVRHDWNLNSQGKDEKLDIIVELKQGDEPAVVQKHHSSQTKENPAATDFSKPSDNSTCLAPLPPKKSFLQTLNTPMSSTDVVNQLTKLIRPPSLPYGATKQVPVPQACDDSPKNMYKLPVGPSDNSCDSASSTTILEPCSTGSSARILVQRPCEPTRLTQTSNLQSEISSSEARNFVSNKKDENFLSTIDHGNSVFQLIDNQSFTKKTRDSDPLPPEMKFSVPSSTSVAVLNSPNVAVCQQGGIIYINDSFSPVSLKKDGIPHHLLQSSYSSSSSDSSFQLPDHMKQIDLSIVSIDSDNSIPQGCEKFLLDMDSKEILVNTQGWDMTRCEVAKQEVGLGDKKMLVQLKKAHEDFMGTLGGQLSPEDEVGC